MKRVIAPAQERSLAALVESGRMKRIGTRFFADERAPRSFGFTAVMQLVERGLARITDLDVKAVEPTAAGRRIHASLQQRAAA